MVKKTLITALLVAAFTVGSVKQLLAQDSSRSITIIPPKFELFGNPGDQLIEKVRVKNNSDQPTSFDILVEDFSSSGEEGQVVLEEGQSDTQYSLAKWIEPEQTNIILQPNEEVAFSYVVNVPRNAEPGGHYASILFEASAGEAIPGSASVASRIGALVLLRVSGTVTEKATIETFDTPKYSQKTPVNFSLRLKNEGNTHIRPKGTVVVTDVFGKKVDELALNGQNVLPGVVRKMDTEWAKPVILGYYTATLIATYGQQNLPLTASQKFLVVSPSAGIILGIGTLAIIILAIAIISGRKRLAKALKVMVSGK